MLNFAYTGYRQNLEP